MESEVKAQIQLLEKNYQNIKDFLSGAEYGIDLIRESLQSFKDNLSKTNILIMALIQTRLNTTLELVSAINPILNAIDIALNLIEMNPKQARGMLQLSLSMSSVKIENIMAFVSLFKDMI